jgi:alpha-glucuronidase
VIQHIYDAHYQGAEAAQKFVDEWSTLHDLVDTERFDKVMTLQRYQADYAIVWRDAITRWFFRMSGVPDDKGRVGHSPERIPASGMTLDGYSLVGVTPWEAASEGKAAICADRSQCSATMQVRRPAGSYDIAVQYFDLPGGVSTFELELNGKRLATWTADNVLPGKRINAETSTRYTVSGVALKPEDKLTLVGHPDKAEPAPFDYVVIYPASQQSAQHD